MKLQWGKAIWREHSKNPAGGKACTTLDYAHLQVERESQKQQLPTAKRKLVN